MEQTKNIIGRIVYVDFPDLGLSNVMAKIDTGAYRGTLHCKDVKMEEAEGSPKLSFVPLDLKHPDYSHKAVVFDEFSSVIVKRTDGKREQRYVVKTRIAIDKKTYNIEISLSDRTDMRSPVLLGRRFLHGRFIVDVDA